MKEIVDNNVFKIMPLPFNFALVWRFEDHNSVHPKWFVKYVFSTKEWFVKTSTRIVKYESRVVKSNPANIRVNFELTLGLTGNDVLTAEF